MAQPDIAGSVKETIFETVDCLPVERAQDIRDDHTLIEDLGCDSLDMIELVIAFEERFDIEINDDETEKVRTVGDIVVLVSERIGHRAAA